MSITINRVFDFVIMFFRIHILSSFLIIAISNPNILPTLLKTVFYD